MTDVAQQAGGGRTSIRPFSVNIPEAELTELRRRISATRWPDRETVTDQSQGPELATLQKLARRWGSEYDWRKVEARLNALPNFITEIDGLDIHFIHVRSKHKNALPLIITHGWPGSVISRRGSSRSSWQKSFAPASDHSNGTDRILKLSGSAQSKAGDRSPQRPAAGSRRQSTV